MNTYFSHIGGYRIVNKEHLRDTEMIYVEQDDNQGSCGLGFW